MPMKQVFIGLGANIPSPFGSPEETLIEAARLLSERFEDVMLSPVYKSAPMYLEDQDWFYNAVLSLKTDLSPHALLEELIKLEKQFGRVRDIPNGPRTLDLDILDYDGQVISDETLTLPHPRIHERGFVLYPLAYIAPGWVYPISSESIQTLIQALPADQSLQKISD